MSKHSEFQDYASELFDLMGANAPLFVADLIVALERRGDRSGVRQLRDIQSCLGRLAN